MRLLARRVEAAVAGRDVTVERVLRVSSERADAAADESMDLRGSLGRDLDAGPA